MAFMATAVTDGGGGCDGGGVGGDDGGGEGGDGGGGVGKLPQKQPRPTLHEHDLRT